MDVLMVRIIVMFHSRDKKFWVLNKGASTAAWCGLDGRSQSRGTRTTVREKQVKGYDIIGSFVYSIVPLDFDPCEVVLREIYDRCRNDVTFNSVHLAFKDVEDRYCEATRTDSTLTIAKQIVPSCFIEPLIAPHESPWSF